MAFCVLKHGLLHAGKRPVKTPEATLPQYAGSPPGRIK